MIELIKNLKVAIALNEQLGTLRSKFNTEEEHTSEEIQDYADLTVAVANSSMLFNALEAIATRHGIIIDNRTIYKKFDTLDTPEIVATPTGENIAREKFNEELERRRAEEANNPENSEDED